jgi:hypothetical protein
MGGERMSEDNGLILALNEDGTLGIKKEPFATIECPTEEDYNTLVEAVEKQVPLKPIKDREQGIRYTSAYSCPTCEGGFTGTGIARHCYHCGQKLDWGEMGFENEKDL